LEYGFAFGMIAPESKKGDASQWNERRLHIMFSKIKHCLQQSRFQ
jgi:hypothetical protein